MRSAVFWSVTLIAAAVLVPFAIANRTTVSLGLWPLPFLLEAPVYLLVLLTLLAGFFIGAACVWIAGHRSRRELRRRRRRLEALERELAATQARLTNQTDRLELQPPGDHEKHRAPAGLTLS
jgi:lipopolysaccharide assembly protein A